MVDNVKQRRAGYTRLSSKHQVTIPIEVVRAAGLTPGDEFAVEMDTTGAVRLVRAESWLDAFGGSLTGVYPQGYLNDLRDEWQDAADRDGRPAS